MKNEIVARLENVTVKFADREILKNINLTVGKTDRICITGTSGKGKTTLMRVLTGFQQVTAGTVQTAPVRTAVVFQEDRLFMHRTALGNLKAVGIEKERAEKYLNAVGLGADMKKKPSQMSGGMKRRLALARALAYGGELYVFDEPLTGLDRETADRMLELIKKETEGKALVMITHDEFALRIPDVRIVKINADDEKSALI
ncbi:MAG: ATP-binding cassette domain-containing protein [Clostridia bacterium]|nr:ATP-binding cassette domain-containing protein [Clostridia bacterium]